MTRIIPFLLICLFRPAAAQPDTVAAPAGEKRLQGLLEDARTSYDNFKNGPAFQSLVEYAALKEELHHAMAEAEQQAEANRFRLEADGIRSRLKELETSVGGLRENNLSITDGKNRLLRNTIFMVLALGGAILCLLYFVRRKLRFAERLQAESETRLANARTLTDLVESSGKLASDMLFSFNSLFELTPRTQSQIGKLRAMSVTLNKNTTLLVASEEIVGRINELAENGKSALEQFGGYFVPSEEKEVTNLNAIIDDTVHLSYLWMKSRYAGFECAISLDLEKILPEIKAYPEEIRKALFYFFNNAFYSVYRRAAAEKDFEGRVTIITRRLPRFVQVRIRDNGTGIPDKLLEKIYEPFFSTVPAEHGTGLGLSLGRDIIQQRHEGEVSFETDTGNGTDMLIRFPLEF